MPAFPAEQWSPPGSHREYCLIESLRLRLGQPDLLILRERGEQTGALLSLALPGVRVTLELPTGRGSANRRSILSQWPRTGMWTPR